MLGLLHHWSVRFRVMPELWVVNGGRLRYADGVALQERVRARRQAGEIADTLLFVEHDPVYTKGRRSEPGHLPMGEDWYRMQGIEVEETDRAGRSPTTVPGSWSAIRSWGSRTSSITCGRWSGR
jgi:lipoate-protein ligase B